MIIKRKKYLDKVLSSIQTQKLVLILWTRQIWKTTLLEMLKEELTWKVYYYSFEDDFFKIDFKDKKDFINYFTLTLWVDFYNEWYFLFDEFQYVKHWEQILKSLYDDKEIKLKFIVTGSWLWTYNEENNWTLVWRWEEIFMYPLDFFEFLEFKGVSSDTLQRENINENISSFIEKYYFEYLTFGWYPNVVISKTKEEKIQELERIISRYIDRDVAYFLKKDDIVDFRKFFIYLSSQIWNLVKKEAIWEFLWLKVWKIEKYLYILEKTLFIYRTYPYFTDKTKELSGQPKMYFADIWVINYLQKSFNFRENDWKIVENFVFNELLKNKKYNSDEIKTYKKITKSEIDFIYDWLDSFVPVEVKSWDKKAIPKIFFSFEETYNKKTSFYVLTSLKENKKDSIENKDLLVIPNWFIWKVFNKN